MKYKRINITLPQDLLDELDAAVAADYTKRSAFVREAITLKIQLESAVEQELTNADSMLRLVQHQHLLRMTK